MPDPRESVKGTGASKVAKGGGQQSANDAGRDQQGGPSAGDDPRSQQGTQRG